MVGCFISCLITFLDKELLGTSASLLVTGALLVVTMFAIRNNKQTLLLLVRHLLLLAMHLLLLAKESVLSCLMQIRCVGIFVVLLLTLVLCLKVLSNSLCY